MSPRKEARLSIALDPSSLKAFQDACAKCGENPGEVIRHWVKSALAQRGRGKTSSGALYPLPGQVMAPHSKAKSPRSRRTSSPPRLQIRLKRKDYDALMAACKKRDLDVSSVMRLWVAYLLGLNKDGQRIMGKAEPEAFKDDPRKLVFDGHLQIHLPDTATLTALKDACRQQGVEHSSCMRGWISHILGLHRRGLDINPPDILKRRRQ